VTVIKKICVAAAAVALAVTAVGCSGGRNASGDEQVIRFAFAPDPVWDLLSDSGELAKWQSENKIRIETSSTWDEFTYFAGGHGDIVSMSTQEVPVLEQQTGIKTVTFGKYNYQRVPMLKRADSPYETLADIPKGSKICVSGPTSNTAFWTVLAQQMHGLDYRVGGGDFKLIVNDHFVNPTNLLRGDCEAAAVIPEAAVPQLRKGELKIMYGGELPFQLYKEFAPDSDDKSHVVGNTFTATEQWYDAHKDLAVKFLELWQRGVDLFQEQKADVIRKYPQHFSVESQEDIDWITDFMSGDNNWFVDNVSMDADWIPVETNIWTLMKELNPKNANYLPADAPKPRFEALAPTEDVKP
jgi:ABC-type nitrate/sulfonate/bicarbonate transport system substrate-binding protein